MTTPTRQAKPKMRTEMAATETTTGIILRSLRGHTCNKCGRYIQPGERFLWFGEQARTACYRCAGGEK
jgi:uncharacterized OB-fold protein